MLLFFLIAVNGALSATHTARVILGGVGGLSIDIGLWHWHDTDVLSEVVLAGEVTNVVPIDSRALLGLAC